MKLLYKSSRSPGLLTAYSCLPGVVNNSDVSLLVSQFSFVYFAFIILVYIPDSFLHRCLPSLSCLNW